MLDKIISLIKQQQKELAESEMMNPSDDHLLVAGQWQGLNMALQIIDRILSENDRD